MSERIGTKRCIKALYKYSSFPFPFLSFGIVVEIDHYNSKGLNFPHNFHCTVQECNTT